MKKLTTLLIAAAAAMYFTGCGDTGTDSNNGIQGNNTSSSSTGDKTGDSDTDKKEDYDGTAESTDDLPKCNAKRNEKVYYVEDEDITYTCNYDEDLEEGEWVKSKKKAKKPVADETIESGDDLPKCNDKRDGDIYYIEEDDVYVSCDSDKGKWMVVDTDPDDNTDKSSSSTVVSTIPCGDLWCGYKASADGNIDRVITGRDAGDETSGWWWEYNDQKSGGESYFSWPVSKGNKFSDESFEPIVRYCGGVCGTVTLDNGILDYNFAGIGFNVAGEDANANVSAWGGICVVYTSEAPIIVEMGLENETFYGSDLPKYTLTKGANNVTNIQWGDFEQAGWLDAYGEPYPTITGSTAAKQIRSLKFKFSGTEGSYDFNIMSLGTYGSCR